MKLNQIPKRLSGLLSALPKLHKPNRSNLFLLAVSLGAAVLLWANLSPDDPKSFTFEGISVDLSDTQAESYQLKLLPESEAALSTQKVEASINGNKTVIGALTQDDVEVYVDFEKVKKDPGEQTLSLGLRYKKNRENGGKEGRDVKTDGGTEVKLTPATVNVSLDRYDSKTVPVSKTVLHPNLKAADAVTRIDDNNVTVDPANVIVKGPSTKIDQIDHVCVTVNSTGKLTETKTFNDISDYTLMDSDGRKIDNSSGYFSVQMTSFSVTFPVYYQRSIPVTGTITNIPDDEEFRDFIYQRVRIRTDDGMYKLPGYGEDTGNGSENNLFLTLRTDDSDPEKKQMLDSDDYFAMFNIPLNMLSIDEETAQPIKVDGFEVVPNISAVYISLEDTDLTKQLFWVPNSSITFRNNWPGYQYQLDQPNGQTAVWLIGRPEELEAIKGEDLKLTADVSKNTKSGLANVDVSVELPVNAGFVWASETAKNKPTVDVNITAATS